MKITKTSPTGIEMIKKFEGFVAKPYLCPAKVWTIGYGTTRYPNGKKVAPGDPTITQAKATEYLQHDLAAFERQVDALVRDDIKQKQFDALVSFCYNLGAGALQKSTLLRRINTNPSDPKIKEAFLMWVNVNGKPHAGIRKRRQIEADYYFS